MLKVFFDILIVFGLSFTFWSLVGLARLIFEKTIKSYRNYKKNNGKTLVKFKPNLTENFSSASINQVAICMAAHNEEMVISDSLNALKKIISAEHIYVANDASQDKTSELVKQAGCNVYDIFPNGGKAKALATILDKLDLYERYKYVVFVDADTRLREDYLKNALPLFDDPDIVAVAGYARSVWKNNIFIAYRSRIWFTLQTFFRFGMSSKFANLNMIVPGFASMYRTSVLSQLDIARPGLVIEDFNMTFELQKKKLGKIAHYSNITGFTQDPHTFQSYTSQIKRWNLGFWQTVRAHGIWPSLFWFNLLIYLTEMTFTGLVFLFWPAALSFAISFYVLSFFIPALVPNLPLIYNIFEWLIVLIAFDYIFTLITALARNRPQLLFYAPTMLFFRWLDAYYYFATFFLAFKTDSSGTWESPERWSAEKQKHSK